MLHTEDPIKTKREEEWEQIEALIMTYQQGFIDSSFKRCAEFAASELAIRFTPLFTKYLKVLKNGEVNFYDPETKAFVFSFIDKTTKSKFPSNKKEIIYKFKFIVKTYGILETEEMLSDMYEIFFKIAKRYKQIGRSFCGYLYNVFYHEMSRHIKKHIENPINIGYKISSYNEFSDPYDLLEDLLIDFYEKKEILDLEWIMGLECNKVFEPLCILDRKILIAYYINDQNDKQISENFGIHINTVNQRRRKALCRVLQEMPSPESLSIKRSRKVFKEKNAFLYN